MLGSKNDFFKQDAKTLKQKRRDMKTLLRIKEFSNSDVFWFGVMYDYFCKNPEQYDGETLVKDLNDLPNLSLAGLEHDYEYIVCKVWKSPIAKIRSDWAYAKRHEQLGKGWLIPYTRAIGLILSTPFYYLIKLYNHIIN